MYINPKILGIINFSLTVFISNAALGQTIAPNSNGYFTDALRYSQTTIAGSSRVQGMAGVGVATGADISSAHINPAGLGLLRKGEFSITGSLGYASSNANYLGTANSDMRLFFGIPNFGVVFSNAKDDLQEGDFRGGSFAISFTKNNNFQSQTNIAGTNSTNSILDDFAQQGNALGESNLLKQLNDYDNFKTDGFSNLTGAAYYSRLIDNANYFQRNNQGQVIDTVVLPDIWSNYQKGNNTIQQSELIKIKNGMYQWDFSYGANYKEKVYFGLGIGLSRINYIRNNEYNEVFENQPLNSLQIIEKYSARGGGINLKGGLIFRPNDVVRFGISFTTPTYFSINETSDGNLSSVVNGKNLTVPLLQSINQFSMFSPARIAPGVAFFLGKHGFISADVEVLNYGSGRLINEPGKNYYNGDNKTIQNIYQTTANLKLGAEFRYEALRFRAGYAFFGDPYTDGKITPFSTAKGFDRSKNAVTVGFGIRQSDMYFDLAVVTYISNKSYYQMYNSTNADEIFANNQRIVLVNSGPAPIAEITNNLTTINFTIGTFFGR